MRCCDCKPRSCSSSTRLRVHHNLVACSSLAGNILIAGLLCLYYDFGYSQFVVLIFHGIGIILDFQNYQADSAFSLPTMTTMGSHHEEATDLGSILSTILNNKDSRNIFMFLIINLLFMGVEMLYGI